MDSWLDPVKTEISLNNGFVLLTIIATKGSTPCTNGDKIVFTKNENSFGSIGGGNLEFKSLAFAKEMLGQKMNTRQLVKYPLGATLGQCCGGYVKVLFESFIEDDEDLSHNNSWIEQVSMLYKKGEDFILATIIDIDKKNHSSTQKCIYTNNNFYSSIGNKKLSNFIEESASNLMQSAQSPTIVEFEDDSETKAQVLLEKVSSSEVLPVVVFGAGHISRALMPIIINLPIKLYWIDDRQEQFDQYDGDTSQINIICDDFLTSMADLPNEIYTLVITYSHQIDFEICEKMIIQNNFSYLGMIGSSIKGRKFRDRFAQKNYSKDVIEKFTCPIGEKQKLLKSPTSIAITIAMDLINFIENKKQSELS
jgi:xanthine dehydrogenase accessory factor